MFLDEASLAAYRSQFAGVTIPRVCERVLFTDRSKKTDRYRVSGYYCPVTFIPSEPEDVAGQIVDEVLREEIARLSAKGHIKVRCCTPEEATHVVICGVASFLVRIDRVQCTGELVEWTPERIQQEEDSIRQHAQMFPFPTIETAA